MKASGALQVIIPGHYLEIEFFANGTIEIERFGSQGVEPAWTVISTTFSMPCVRSARRLRVPSFS